jgi:hypothetical protein
MVMPGLRRMGRLGGRRRSPHMANAAASSDTPSFWRRPLSFLRRMLARALGRSRDLQGGAAEDTRTGEGRRVEGVGGEAEPTAKKDHEVLKELRWRAACEILEHMGGLTIPRQLRAHVDAVGDPVKAVQMLAEDLGCDVDRLKNGDVAEQDVFLERIEMLVALDRILDSAPPRFKELVIKLFHGGDLARLRILAETRRNLQTALGFCEDVRKERRMACVERLKVELEAALADVEHVSWEESDELLRGASSYMRAAERLADVSPRWNTTLKEATLIWPADWRSSHHPKRMQLDSLDRRGIELNGSLTAEERLTPEEAERAIAAFEKAMEMLEELLTEAHEHALHGHKRDRSTAGTRRPGRRETVNDWLQMVGLEPGVRPNPQELAAAYREIMRKIYPKVNAGDPKAEELVKHINAARDKLKAYFRYK